MRVGFLFCLLGTMLPSLLLVILTFIGCPQLSRFTERLVGPEPEIVRYYSVSKVILGRKISFDVVPRILPGKLLPAIVVLVGLLVQFVGVLFCFFSRGGNEIAGN
jgi:hypothetical protein